MTIKAGHPRHKPTIGVALNSTFCSGAAGNRTRFIGLIRGPDRLDLPNHIDHDSPELTDFTCNCAQNVPTKTAPNELLWCRGDGSPLRPPTTSHWFCAAVKRCQAADDTFPRVTVHELRHTAASLMIASGANVKTVQAQLGHKSATMTLDQYGHLFPDDLDDVADKMDDLVSGCAQSVPKNEADQNG
ncbi:tyrosine-type recombinase/integrase [Mycobacterium colombiense]